MEYITNTFRYVVGLSNKKSIKGRIISEDKEKNRTLLLVQEGESYWVIKWFDNDEYIITPIAHSFPQLFDNDEMV